MTGYKMKGLSVHYSYTRWRYWILHPIKWIKEICGDLRAAYQRAKYGWAPRDTFSFDYWFMEVIPPMLRYLADDSEALGAWYDREPFDTPEKWHAFIRSLADRIESCKEEEQDKRNEYYADYMRELMSDGKMTWNYESDATDSKDLHAKYFARSKELWEEADRTIQEALKDMSKYFFALWS